MKITKKCIRCKCMFQYGDMDKSLCGQMTNCKKCNANSEEMYCNICKVNNSIDKFQYMPKKKSRRQRNK